MTIHEYYTRMKTTLDALRDVGNNMNDDDFVLDLNMIRLLLQLTQNLKAHHFLICMECC